MARLILIRHCESSGQAPEAALTEAGSSAAEALADRLAILAPDAVYSSPYRRARATVQPFADRAGLTVVEDARLHERVLSAEPLDDWLDHVRRSYDDLDHIAGVGGESLRATQTRALVALAEIAARGHRLPAVASHGNLISSVLRAANPDFGFDDWRTLKNPDLFELEFHGSQLVNYRRID